VETKRQLDATEVFIADLIACSTCFEQHYAHHQELKSIIQWLLPVAFGAVWSGVELKTTAPNTTGSNHCKYS
jgi:alkylhydroperoxidase family enzyme